MQSIGTDGVSHPLQQCLAADRKRRECGRGAHAKLVELEPSLMPACQPGARVRTRDATNSTRPRRTIADVLAVLPNKTVVLLGDSTMRQFFDAIVCDLLRLRLYPCIKGVRWRCRRLWRKAGGAALPFVRAQHADGRTWTDFHLVYLHSFPPTAEQLWTWAREGAIDLLIFNFGLHYLLEPPRRAAAKGNVSAYAAHMGEMFSRAAAMMRAHPHTLSVFQQSVAQHFGCKSSYFNDAEPKNTRATCSGDWDTRDRTRYFADADAVALAGAHSDRPDCRCFEFEPPARGDRMMVALRARVARDLDALDLSVGWRNALAMDILARDFAGEPIGVLRWFDITRSRSQYHRMSCCTSVKSTCDCTHYCYNEIMYHEGFAELQRTLSTEQARTRMQARRGG
ncbi:hypothetical protein KFE25_008829 [Diacronema lutheri]|uniref:SGNH domain-containing protein n=1 Tax=Diacronema lutheri TaxID=2081491 RepID=A0A8J6CJW4_DIALT|nr:hypothetical protein KFE25_008829 [Diacronema lutheri]